MFKYIKPMLLMISVCFIFPEKGDTKIIEKSEISNPIGYIKKYYRSMGFNDEEIENIIKSEMFTI